MTSWRRDRSKWRKDSHPVEESRAWKMSLSANFPEEPWLRLRLGNGKCAGRRRSRVHPEKLFAKSCWERQRGGTTGLGRGKGKEDLGGQGPGSAQGWVSWEKSRRPKLPASSLGSASSLLCPPHVSGHLPLLEPRGWQTRLSRDVHS
jgi:hypothetical protein